MPRPSFFAFVLVTLFVTLSVGAHLLIVRWLLRVVPDAKRARGPLVTLAVVLSLLPPLARWVAAITRSHVAISVYALSASELLAAAIFALPLLVVGAADRLRRSLRARSPGAPSSQRVMGRREAIERAGGVALFGTTAVALGWGTLRGRRAYETVELVVPIAGLPRALDGYCIVQISDLHVGLFLDEAQLADGLGRVRALRPDLLVVTGDLVDADQRFADVAARQLRALEANDGIVAILGNHDYYAGAGVVAASLRAHGISVLVNDALHLRASDGGGFALLGVDDRFGAGYGGPGPDLERAIARAPRQVPRILLAHQPKYFERAAGQVALQLSGHTHGGQINPGFRPIDLVMQYVAGRYERGGSVLYVNRGFGTTGPPTRLGSRPELTKVILVSG